MGLKMSPEQSLHIALLAVSMVLVQACGDGPPSPRPGTPVLRNEIVFTSNRDGNDEIYVMAADGTNPRRLTNNPAEDFTPAISPDGTRIAFASAREGQRDLFVMDAEGGQVTNLTNTPDALEDWPVWSPDGRQIAYHRQNLTGDFHAYIMDADGTDQAPFELLGNGFEPTWSPDGSRIAFRGSRSGGPAGPTIFAVNLDGTGLLELTPDAPWNGGPVWSPDGSRLAFERTLDTGFDELFVMRSDGTEPVRLTTDPARDLQAAWAPDGSRIAFFSDRTGDWEIFVMNADGSAQQNLTNNPADDREPDWSRVP